MRKINVSFILLLLGFSLVSCGGSDLQNDPSSAESSVEALSGCALLCSVIADLCADQMKPDDYEQCPVACQMQMDYEKNELECQNGLDLKNFDICLNHMFICEDVESCFDYVVCE